MTQVELLMQEVELAANTMTDEVLERLLAKLTHAIIEADPFACRKHTIRQLEASIAAIKLWRLQKCRRFAGFSCGGWTEVNATDAAYFNVLSWRTQTSDAYHAEECTCHLDRKARYPLYNEYLKTEKEKEHVG